MSLQQTSSLLWINKDATNVHKKKHIAEVNAHVQKSSSKKRAPKQTTRNRKVILPARRVDIDEKSTPSPGGLSSSSLSDFGRSDVDSSKTPDDSSHISVAPSDQSIAQSPSPPGSKSTALIFSSYLEEDGAEISDSNVMDDDDFAIKLELSNLNHQIRSALPSSIDASNPLPGLVTDLCAHDKMLVHTHLTYMPHMFFGLSNRAAYCPIRTASVVNMLKAPVGILWVLISLDMFLETARKSNTRKAAILQRKSQAYQLMSGALTDQSQSNDANRLLGPSSAAIAEMFCGDPDKALMHVNGIEAFITARGGMEYVKQMELTTSMPLFAVSAYRTLLQDNLRTLEAFERARSMFIETMRSLHLWNSKLSKATASRPSITRQGSPPDEGFDGNYDLVDIYEELRGARQRAFEYHPLIRRFVGTEFNFTKPGEKVDHFIVLFNLNRALAEHGTNVRQAINFIEDLVNDIEKGGSTRGADSSIKISGVLRLLTNRQAKMYPHQPSVGVAFAWDALDALEVMKLLTPDTQRFVCTTLHSLLLGRHEDAMTEAELSAIDSTLVTEWYNRHIHLLPPNR